MDVTVPPWVITVILSNILLIQLLLQPSGIFPISWLRHFNPHCKDIVPKIRNKYSQKWNCVASFTIPTWHIRSKIGGPIMGIYKLLTVSFLGTHKSDIVCRAAYLHGCPFSLLRKYCFHVSNRRSLLSVYGLGAHCHNRAECKCGFKNRFPNQ